jgi:RNA-binding protein
MSEEGNPNFSAADVDLVLHATEDRDRVLQAIEDLLTLPAGRFSASPSEGHHKNKILFLKATLSGREAGSLANLLVSHLNSADRVQLLRLIHEYSDEKGNLYIRLDKQRVCQGRVLLSETDAIRIRFRPVKRYKHSGIAESSKGLFRSSLRA